MEKAILKTLAYADIFDYPLKESEVKKWLIGKKVVDDSYFRETLTRLVEQGRTSSQAEYYFLPGRAHLVTVRRRRKKASLQKIKLAEKVADRLKLIPLIKMVALSGALAMENAREEDDADLMIVTAPDRLWLTRVPTILLTELFADRRRPQDTRFANKICLNVFLDEGALGIEIQDQDIYFAHEVAQLRPLWDRGGVYRRFIEENSWIAEFLPNWQWESPKDGQRKPTPPRPLNLPLINTLNSLLERLAYTTQLRYMAKRRTREEVSARRAFFHPFDYRAHTLAEYQKRLKKLGIE